MKSCKKRATLQPCNVCSLQLFKNHTDEHLVVFHPEIKSLIRKLYKKLKGVPKVHAFPAMDCSNLCATKILANYLIVDMMEYEPSCLALVKQLSVKLETLSEFSFVSNKQMCYLCGLNLLSTTETITHLTLQHPKYLALVLFLRFRPLSELKFYAELADNQVTSEKLLQRIDGNRVLGVRQPIIQIKKLPDHLYQECIANGFVNLKKKTRTWSPYDHQSNPRLNKISTKAITKMKETATKPSKKKNPVVTPGSMSNSCPENSNPFDPQPNPRLKRISTIFKKMKETTTKSSKKKNHVVAPENVSNSCKENFDSQPNPRLSGIDKKVKQNMKETATKSSKRKKQRMKETATESSKRKNPVVGPRNMSNSCPEISDLEMSSQYYKKDSVEFAPRNTLKSHQENSEVSSLSNAKNPEELPCGNTVNLPSEDTDSQECIIVNSHQENSEESSLSNAKNNDELAPGNTVNSHSEKDQLRRQSEKEKLMKKQILIKKLIDKHHEKEARKEVVYWQRGLTVYVKRNQKYLCELEEQLLIARKLLRNVSGYESLLMQVNSNLESDKVRKTVKFYLKKIYKAIENVQTFVSKGDGSKRMEQPLLQSHRNVSTPKNSSNKKLNSNKIDLVNSALLMEDKQLIDCYYCRKLNCEGLHPEKFIH